MAAPLTIFSETLPLEKPHEFLSRQRRQPRAHLGDLDLHLGHARVLSGDRQSSRFQRFQVQVDGFPNIPLGFGHSHSRRVTTSQRRCPCVEALRFIGLNDYFVGARFHAELLKDYHNPRKMQQEKFTGVIKMQAIVER